MRPIPRSPRRSSGRSAYFVLGGTSAACREGPRQRVPYDGGIVPDPDGIITAGHENKTARTVAFRQGERVNEPALSAMFRQIIANNRAGGWRKLTDQAGHIQSERPARGSASSPPGGG